MRGFGRVPPSFRGRTPISQIGPDFSGHRYTYRICIRPRRQWTCVYSNDHYRAFCTRAWRVKKPGGQPGFMGSPTVRRRYPTQPLRWRSNGKGITWVERKRLFRTEILNRSRHCRCAEAGSRCQAKGRRPDDYPCSDRSRACSSGGCRLGCDAVPLTPSRLPRPAELGSIRPGPAAQHRRELSSCPKG